jgi:hypothetical protein
LVQWSYCGELTNGTGTSVALLWNTAVEARLNAWITAMALHLSESPFIDQVAGIVFNETALGHEYDSAGICQLRPRRVPPSPRGQHACGYDGGAQVDHDPLFRGGFVSMNGTSVKAGQKIGDWMLLHPRTGTGTPDVTPKTPKGTNHPCANSKYQSSIACAPAVQSPDYSTQVTDSFDQSFSYATSPVPDGLHASFLTFSYAVGAGPNAFTFADVSNNIATHPIPNTTRPWPVGPIASPPVANNDSAGTSEGTRMTIDVAANDTDPDGDLAPASANTTCPTCATPTSGSLVNNGNGSFDYTPNLTFNGSDGFVYEICDAQSACDTASVDITVVPVASPPVATDDSASTSEGTTVTIDVATNDTDPDGDLDPASANTTCPTCATPTNGTLVNNGNGSFDYAPNLTFSGSDGFVYEICDSASLCDTATVSLTVTAPSSDLIFADGFESTDLSAWTSSATDLGDLSVSGAAALVGSTGLQALIDDNTAIHVIDDEPTAESDYRARFYFDPNSVSMVSGDAHYIFTGYSGTSTEVVRAQFRFRKGNYELMAALRSDRSSWTNTSWLPLSDAPHTIELYWQAGTSAGANDGGLTLWLDGAQRANLTGVDNATRRIDRVRLGPVAGIDTGTRGTYYFDAFESRRQTYIGP